VAGTKQSKIVQFRDAKSALDTGVLDLALRIHGELVAAYSFHGQLGKSSPLYIYSMEKLPGTPYVSVQSQYLNISRTLLEAGLEPSNTIVDFALYVRYSAIWPCLTN